MKSKIKTSTTAKKKHLHMPNRRYAVAFFYAGLSCLAVSIFISSVYVRPANFKTQFRQHQLADCLKTNTAAASCYVHFGTKK